MLVRDNLTITDVSAHRPDMAERPGYSLVYTASGDGKTGPALPAPASMVAAMEDQCHRIGGAWRIVQRETAWMFR